jgi:Flp pilus assembly protein TadB
MSYAVEWMHGVVVIWAVLLLLVVPEFAVIAVLLLALAALVALVALAAAALVSPYLLVRTLRRHRARPTTRRSRGPVDWPSAMLGVARSLRRQTGRGEPVLRSTGFRRGATDEAHR